MDEMHEFKVRVYYKDTDAGGIVYHANYLNYGEMARIEFFRDLGFSTKHLAEEMDCQFVVRKCEVGYHAVANLEDELTVLSRVENIKRTSLTFKHLIYCEDNLICTMQVMLVCINKERKPVRIPDEVLAALT